MMIDLQEASGLPLKAEDDGLLVFAGGLPAVEPHSLQTEMLDVLLDRKARKNYIMYRVRHPKIRTACRIRPAL